MIETGENDSTALRAHWLRALTALAAILLWQLYLYWDTARLMVGTWIRSDTFAHCFLIPPIVLWLIWRKRAELALMRPSPSPWLLLLSVAAGLVWLLGELAAVNSVTQLMFTALIVVAAPALLGLKIARVIAFPLGFLFFMVPIGEFVIPIMMEWTADFTVPALRLSGIPVYREGLHFVIPTGNWSVVEACSGVRYLIASFTVGTLFAYLTYGSFKRRFIFICASLVTPIIANWLRAYMIVMLGHLSNNAIAAGADHLFYGWVFFGAVIIIMFKIGARWSEEAPVFKPSATFMRGGPPIRARALYVWAISLAAVVALPPIAEKAILRSEVATPVLLAAPAVSTWAPGRLPVVQWRPAFTGASAEWRGGFGRDGKQVGVYVGYYRNQGQGRKLVSSENVLVKGNDIDWKQLGEGERGLVVAGKAVSARTARLSGPTSTGVVQVGVWQWYSVDGTLTASDLLAKLLSARGRLVGRGDDGAVVILYAPGSAPESTMILDEFVRAEGPAIEAMLRRAREAR